MTIHSYFFLHLLSCTGLQEASKEALGTLQGSPWAGCQSTAGNTHTQLHYGQFEIGNDS